VIARPNLLRPFAPSRFIFSLDPQMLDNREGAKARRECLIIRRPRGPICRIRRSTLGISSHPTMPGGSASATETRAVPCRKRRNWCERADGSCRRGIASAAKERPEVAMSPRAADASRNVRLLVNQNRFSPRKQFFLIPTCNPSTVAQQFHERSHHHRRCAAITSRGPFDGRWGRAGALAGDEAVSGV